MYKHYFDTHVHSWKWWMSNFVTWHVLVLAKGHHHQVIPITYLLSMVITPNHIHFLLAMHWFHDWGVARSTKCCGSPRWVCIPTHFSRRWRRIRRMTSPSSWKVWAALLVGTCVQVLRSPSLSHGIDAIQTCSVPCGTCWLLGVTGYFKAMLLFLNYSCKWAEIG